MEIDTMFKIRNQKIVFAPTPSQIRRFKATTLKLTVCAGVGVALALAYNANTTDKD